MKSRLAWVCVATLAFAALAALSTWAKTINIMVDLLPEAQKKPAPGYSVDGRAFHYRDMSIDVVVEYLPPPARASWFGHRKLKDPFGSFVRPEDNYAFFRVRFENLQKEENVEFTPGSSMFGTGNLVDDIAVYQMFYKESDGEARLATVGKAMFFKALHLPPGVWIERLMLFKYDESYQQKSVPLVISNILLGREGLDLIFPFVAKFKKEKR